MRNKRVAHVDRNERYIRLTNEEKIGISELILLRDAVANLYKALSFGAVHNIFLSVEYSNEVETRDSERTSDIEEILNFLALESYTVNLPEMNPKRFSILDPSDISEENFNIWNKYRKMKGLFEISTYGDRFGLNGPNKN